MASEAGPAVDQYGIPIIPEAINVSQRKRTAIIAAAAEEFLRHGYAAASVDVIAASAAVSKPTIYKHFGSKERLFLAVIGGILPTTYADLKTGDPALADSADLRTALVEVFLDWARVLLRDDIMSLRRLVIGEIDRFPQLGQLWYQVTYDMNNQPLIAAFTALHERGVLNVEDPALAVQQLVATVGIPQMVKTFKPDAEFTDAELRTLIGAGVDTFLARYTAA